MTREWVVLAAASLLAWATSALIYWQFIVPRLSQVQAVPMTWWALMLSPLGLVIVWAGYRSRSLLHVLAVAVVIVLPRAVIEFFYALLTGRPVAHDVHVHDTYFVVGPYAVGILAEVVVFGVAVGLLAVLSRWVRQTFGYDESLARRPGG